MAAYNTRSGSIQCIIGPTQFVEGDGTEYYNSGVWIFDDNTLRLFAGRDFRKKTPSFPLHDYERRWLHVDATYDEAVNNGTGRLYINGVLRSELTNMGPCASVPLNFYIASSRHDEIFTGMLDEIRVFEYAICFLLPSFV